MERYFYNPINPELMVPEENRYWLNASNMAQVAEAIWAEPLNITYGGWGQDGHIAYNQARRHPFSQVTIEELRNSTIRLQENNIDTVLALAHRTFGAAYQFVPPMSVTLGMKECLSARKVRLFSDTGAWKQTALRVALFGQRDIGVPNNVTSGTSRCAIDCDCEKRHVIQSVNIPNGEFGIFKDREFEAGPVKENS